ncbi:MAG: AAA family ATPase [Roseomonas sp.]|nr:AAA family ATPase [Roseomonas sp.]
MTITLNDDQTKALAEILAAQERGSRHLLTGYAGSGKTTLMQALARKVLARGQSIVLTAPTHKAVSVLSAKLAQAGIMGVGCVTIHSLLQLRAVAHGDRLVFERARNADPVMADVVVVDECSMVSEDLLKHIKRHLPMSFVVFVGDPAQLPPVGEVSSATFETKSRSHLATIVRQGAGNPILAAAHTIRESQGGPMDWSWMQSAKAPPLGVYLPADADAWMKKAFTSPEFDADPDAFRYLAWTNARVAEVNAKVRRWRYGDTLPTPFMPDERALIRAPILIDGVTAFTTNEEAQVIAIERDRFTYTIEACEGGAEWVAEVPSWRVCLRKTDGTERDVHMPADDRAFNRVVDRIKDEASEARYRWKQMHDFKASMARLQSIYALTTHNSQGSTFANAFVDVPDIRRRVDTNLLEAQQMFYVAATRPSKALVLVGAGA